MAHSLDASFEMDAWEVGSCKHRDDGVVAAAAAVGALPNMPDHVAMAPSLVDES